MLIEAKNIKFGYSRLKAVLNGVSLAVKAGERVALMGPSGCGKSTLAQIIAGYIKPWSGEILLDNNPPPRTGFSPVQLIYQHPEKAVNPRWKLKKTLGEAWVPDEAFLAEAEISPAWLDRYPNELSGGEIQRFCIARALAPQTRFLIADEITTMLDVITQAQIWELILSQVERRNLGLLAVTHSAELAEKICTKIIRFEELLT
jgi:peptide/nickel transport system ATP-binding protein